MKVLLLYGNNYPNSALNSLAKSLSLLDRDVSVDFISDQQKAYEKIKEYDLLIMGLIWSQDEMKHILKEVQLPMEEIREILDRDIDLINMGALSYHIIQKKYAIPTIIHDTTTPSKLFSEKARIPFIGMPELPKNILIEIKRFEKKEAV